LAVNHIRLGQTEAEIRAALGSPTSKSEPHHEEVVADAVWTLSYPDVTVGFTGLRVTKISCLAQACVTPDSIRIGDSRELVERTYGSGRYDPVGESLTYFSRQSDCAMTFVFYSGRVGTIKLWCDES
jgi:hypothetical protein